MVNIRTINIIYTICIFVNHFAFGITSNLLWATLTDLSFIYNVSSETINYIGTFASLGYLIGSLSGILYKWLNRQLVLICLVAIIAITMSLVPFYGYIQVLFLAVTLNGIGGGSWDSSNNIWLVEMWPERQASIMQSSQFMYGLGTIVSPSLVSFFVSGNSTNSTINESKNHLATPFAVVGVFQIIVPIVFAILFFIKPYRKFTDIHDSNGQVDAPVIQELPNRRYRKLKLLLVALLLASYDAAEIGYFYYSPTMFQNISLTAAEAAHVLSILSASYTFGRLATAFISLKLKPDIIMIYHFVIIIIAQTVLYFGRTDLTTIYVATIIQGYGFSAMLPTILAFTERHLRLSDRIGSLLFFFAGLITIFTPFLIGPYLEKWPTVLFLFEGSYLCVAIVLFIIVKLLLFYTS